jgi:heat shock protein HtpX
VAGESGSFWQLERVNRRRTRALVVKMILVLAAFGLGLDFLFHTVRFSDGRLSGIPWFAAAAAVMAVAQSLRAYFAGADQILGALDAHPISSDEPKNQVVIDVVHEMALAARIPEPRIDLIDDPSPNAFAIGRDPKHSVICVTQGLLDQMDREELQGVIGHEMAHIRNCDIRLTTMVTAIFRGFGVFAARLISIMLSREREYLADASAVEFTRNPTALLRALEHIAMTESPLKCATQGTAQLFIVDPFERADGGRSYKQFINQITRIRLQPGKPEEQRDEEARKFAVNEYPRNLILEAVSSHPPLRERIARLQALIGAPPGDASASEVTDDQLRAKFSTSVRFVQSLASTDPAVMAKVLQSALLALPAGRRLLQEKIGGTQIDPESTSRDPIEQKLFESILASTGDLKPNEGGDSSMSQALAADPAGVTGIGLPDSAAKEALQVETLAKMLGPVAASMRQEKAATQPAAAEYPTRPRGTFLFWIVIALSAGAIVAALALK